MNVILEDNHILGKILGKIPSFARNDVIKAYEKSLIFRKILNRGDYIRPKITVATLGHVDHGKTTLVSSITSAAKLYIERLKQSGERVIDYVFETKPYDEILISSGGTLDSTGHGGKTINTSHITISNGSLVISFQDCPGHLSYIKNAISGTMSSDMALLVVDINKGYQDQTKSHLDLISKLEISHVIIFINKIDSITDLAERENKLFIMSVLIETSVETYPNISFSAIEGSALKATDEAEKALKILEKTGVYDEDYLNKYVYTDDGIKSIFKLLELFNNIPMLPRDYASPFLMSVDRENFKKGHKPILTGRVIRGCYSPSEQKEVYFLAKSGKIYNLNVSEMQTFNREISSAFASDNIAMSVSGYNIDSKEKIKGFIVTDPKSVTYHSSFKVRITLTGRRTGITTGFACSMFYYSTHIPVVITVLNDEGVKAEKLVFAVAETRDVIIELVKPFPLVEGTQFILRGGAKGNSEILATGLIEKIIK